MIIQVALETQLLYRDYLVLEKNFSKNCRFIHDYEFIQKYLKNESWKIQMATVSANMTYGLYNRYKLNGFGK